LIRQGGATLINLNPANSTGYNAAPSISKMGDDTDTGRSRKYAVNIQIELPADLPGQAGRRESTVEIAFEPSRRRILTISGEYTAIGSRSALDQYNASIGAFQAAVQGALGGTWELTGETSSHDDTNKNLVFARTFEEIIFNQSAGSLNDPNIVQQRISILRQIDRPGDSPDKGPVNRLQTIQAQAETWIDKDRSTDLVAEWEGKIKPFLISQAKAQFGLSSVAVISQTPNYDFTQNRIIASLTIKGAGQSNLLQFNRVVEVVDNAGLSIVPVWDKSIFAKHIFQGPATRSRITTDNEVFIGTERIVSQLGGQTVDLIGGTGQQQQSAGGGGTGGAAATVGGVGIGGGGAFGGGGTSFGLQGGFTFNPASSGGGQAPAGGGGAQGSQWVVISKSMAENPLRIGDEDDFIDIINRTIVTQEIWIEAPSQAAGAGFTVPTQ